jgi:2-methylisocitrate lyase-like PEP mutase family enzyme
MSAPTTSADLRSRLAAGESVVLAGVFDCLSALLAREAGHTDMFLSGFAASASLLGVPDFGYLTQTEMADAARRVCHAVPDSTVIVDGDTGYGNALNTIRTIQLYEDAGAAGIFLEDQVWPKRCEAVSPPDDVRSAQGSRGRRGRIPSGRMFRRLQ